MLLNAALLAYIEAKNAESLAWIAEDPQNRWCTTFHTNMYQWAKNGINTVEDFEHMLDMEYEKERRKAAYWNDDDEWTTIADRNYYDYVEQKWSQGEWPENADAHVEAYEAALKKYGVDYIAMIPTQYEVMANQAGFLEY